MYQVIENVGYLAKYPACLYKPRPHRQIIKLQNANVPLFAVVQDRDQNTS